MSESSRFATVLMSFCKPCGNTDHWANVSKCVLIMEKTEKQSSTLYGQLQKCEDKSNSIIQMRFLNELEDLFACERSSS